MKKSHLFIALIAILNISCRETPNPAPKTPPVDKPAPKPSPKTEGKIVKNLQF